MQKRQARSKVFSSPKAAMGQKPDRCAHGKHFPCFLFLAKSEWMSSPKYRLEILISNLLHPPLQCSSCLRFWDSPGLYMAWHLLHGFQRHWFPSVSQSPQIRAAPLCVNMNRRVSDSINILLNKCTGYRTGWTKLSWPLANKTRLWLSFWHERKKGGILLRHAQWEAFSKETSEGPTRWTLGRHLKLSHIYFPSSPPPFPLPGTWFTSSLLVYKVAVQSTEAAMETHTCRWEHRGWHSARAGCSRKAPLSLRPGCKARSMGVLLLQPLSVLSIEPQGPGLPEYMSGVEGDPAPCAGANKPPARHPMGRVWNELLMSYLSRPPKVLV